jgi:hypothetical protein
MKQGCGSITAPLDQISTIQNLNDIPGNLVCWNIVAAIFQTIQGGALFYQSMKAKTPWYLYTNFPQISTSNSREESATGVFGLPDPNEFVAFSVSWYSAIFILLSALDHLVVITPGIRPIYEQKLKKSQNPFRWTEYSLSASLMRVMIAQLSGVTDIHLLFCIFCLTAITMLLGWAHEVFNAKARADGYTFHRPNWFLFHLAWIPHFTSWAIIVCYFLVSVFRGNPPAYLWAIVFILFSLDGVFALIFYLQWAKIGRFQDYVTGEIGFIILSFTSKSLLAWISIIGGAR